MPCMIDNQTKNYTNLIDIIVFFSTILGFVHFYFLYLGTSKNTFVFFSLCTTPIIVSKSFYYFHYFRTCLVNKVYLLVRSKRNKDPQTRLREMFSSTVSFTRFSNTHEL